MERLTIDLVSDVVCPWCYLGKARLELAIAEVQDEVSVDINWRPYQLNPDYPPEGVDHQVELAKKLGGKERMDAAHAELKALGAEVGIVVIGRQRQGRAGTVQDHEGNRLCRL